MNPLPVDSARPARQMHQVAYLGGVAQRAVDDDAHPAAPLDAGCQDVPGGAGPDVAAAIQHQEIARRRDSMAEPERLQVALGPAGRPCPGAQVRNGRSPPDRTPGCQSVSAEAPVMNWFW